MNTRGLVSVAAVVFAAGSAASAQTLTPPNFSLGEMQVAYNPAYTLALSGTAQVNSFRLVATAASASGPYQTDAELTLRAPNGTTLVVGGIYNPVTYASKLLSGTPPAVNGNAQTIDAIFHHNFGPLQGVWTVNFKHAQDISGGTLAWSNIQITPLESTSGACCMPSGLCQMQIEAVCAQQSGIYYGDAVECGSVPPCPQPSPGACCLAMGQCATSNVYLCVEQGGIYHGDFTDCATSACDFFVEVEPNTTKEEANAFTLAAGQSIRGRATGSASIASSSHPASLDMFRIRTTAAPVGIYRHQMVLSNTTAGNVTTLRGINQVAVSAGVWPCSVGSAGAVDTSVQGHLIPVATTNRVNTWYGFGKEEEVYYRVAGVASSTGTYTATLQTTPIFPTALGSFSAGEITITSVGQGHTTDTHIRIYDENLNPIHGFANDGSSINGGAATNNSTPSFLRRHYAPGTYYMALAVTSLATNQGAACDDNVRNGAMLDFPNIAVENSSTTTIGNIGFAVTHAQGTTQFPAIRPGPREIAWFTFTVNGTAAVGACCLGGDTCTMLSETACTGIGGAYSGDNVSCAAGSCSPPPACYANCDGSTVPPVLNVADFTCFLQKFAAGDAYANCDGSTIPPVLNVADFTCFLQKFAAGCP